MIMKKQTVVVLGSNGMAGSMIYRYLSRVNQLSGGSFYHLYDAATDYAAIRIPRDPHGIVKAVMKYEPDIIINCIGMLVKPCDENKAEALKVNALLPHLLSETPARVIHLSTDCVFSGLEGPYKEDHPHTETSNYGKTKSLGELDNDKDLTFRMSIIGPDKREEGTGLFQWFLRFAETEKTVDGWGNALWNGITTLELAKAIHYSIHGDKNSLTGVYHLVTNDFRSKYQLLKEINIAFNADINVNKVQGPKTVNKVLLNTRKDFGYKVSGFLTQLYDLQEFEKL